MVDKLFINKLAAAVILALLVLKLSEFFGDGLVNPKKIAQNSYVVANVAPAAETADDGKNNADNNAAIPPIMPMLAKASGSDGENTAKKCLTCHTLAKGGPDRVGPNLWGIVGSKIAESGSYSFSTALAAKKDMVWDYENLNHFLANPKGFAPGTKMSFVGVAKAEERANLILYLRSLADTPVPMPK